jgi:hypothetical protein
VIFSLKESIQYPIRVSNNERGTNRKWKYNFNYRVVSCLEYDIKSGTIYQCVYTCLSIVQQFLIKIIHIKYLIINETCRVLPKTIGHRKQKYN